MQRALIIAPNWIGDALMAQPLFILLKKLHPRIILDAIAPNWVAPILEQMPEINHVYPTQLAHKKLQLRQRWQLAQTLRAADYDAAFILPNSAKSALIPWLAQIRLRIGYHGEHRYGLINVRHPNPRKNAQRPPMVRHYAALAYAPHAGLPAELPVPRITLDQPKAAQALQRFRLTVQAPLIAFCPGAEYGAAKRWPVEHFATLAQLIAPAFPYAQIITLGAAQDALLGARITEQAPQVRNLCGQTTLNEACALIASASVVVSNDSGLMHIAAALRRPLLALYGSSDPRHTPPLTDRARVQWLQLECSPCFARECPLGHLNCLRQLKPEHVFEQLREMLLTES
ncbi:adp-heptose--lipopolysaccharide heptosyltransferase II protein [Mycoavidus cysteinexigens]|uniref:lipopolysaccharide heptosyltransferase II n=1 Tax=Mycoavidus cysteinexigens TaxID=1553431 RepID=A0A2Z6EXD8_9BURK|nr:lipopolysaccharide heptosyltransferase II [Mycoavidus cysteinexigens]BBE10133.1 adp-heptose--lipopolysaccharide heptosyltransferase II protein [Mycoavidus cysteinexigens]GAM53519.1 ADP-heptose--lipooligosaccharide heptosyltransferase II [bacterium endosymbiont of Mortierella elongata FMR23-6]GLR00549.1 ADP-heptose--LPS heptosyltransferase II [Mycoavidus cysteinexigens]